MITGPAEDGATHLLERRWFAAGRAIAEIRAECEALGRLHDMAQEAWRSAQTRLKHLEALRDALGDTLSAIDEGDAEPTGPTGASMRQRSAA